MTEESRPPRPATGIPVDASGGATVDPTKNVLDLVAAAGRRHDDLMAAQSELIAAKIKRLDDMQALQAAHASEMAQVRTGYESELRQKETERLDAIRAVDVSAVQRSAEVQQSVAVTLAGQVSAAAEANRTSVAAAAVAFETKLATVLSPLNEAVSELRQMQFRLQGQQTEKAEARIVQTDTKQSSQWVVGTLIGAGIGCFGLVLSGIGLLVTLVVIGVSLVIFLNK